MRCLRCDSTSAFNTQGVEKRGNGTQNLSVQANVSYTTFARTTQERHGKAVEYVWRTLEQKGYIYKGEYEGWYSITDECFYTTTQVRNVPPPLPLCLLTISNR